MPKKIIKINEPKEVVSFLEEDEPTEQEQRFHKYYVGIDIGYKFHVATCIPIEHFIDIKQKWKKAKTIKFNSDSEGIQMVLNALNQVDLDPKEFFILMEPTGGHYGYTIMKVLMNQGYNLNQVENKAVKKFREDNLGIKEKTDSIDAKVMAYMGYHKAVHPALTVVRTVTTATPTQILFKTLTRDRWLLGTQLTRRRNQVQQIFSVTNPELKSVFSKPSAPSVLKLVAEYPTAAAISKASEEDLRKALIKAGARNVAAKYAPKLKELTQNSIAVESEHLILRQNWLIEEALRTQDAIENIDKQMESLLFGNEEEGIEPHPYTEILFSLPTMSNTWACTLIGVIGDIERFDTYKQFKRYLGFSAENSQSGISVHKTRLSFDGVRDTRRVLFQMALVLLSPKKKNNVFKEYYDRLVAGRYEKGLGPMPKMKAIGHMCGKLSHVIYGCLRSGERYDAEKHAKACGISMYIEDASDVESIDVSEFEDETNRLVKKVKIK